jgi:hypothetical protein
MKDQILLFVVFIIWGINTHELFIMDFLYANYRPFFFPMILQVFFTIWVLFAFFSGKQKKFQMTWAILKINSVVNTH